MQLISYVVENKIFCLSISTNQNETETSQKSKTKIKPCSNNHMSHSKCTILNMKWMSKTGTRPEVYVGDTHQNTFLGTGKSKSLS